MGRRIAAEEAENAEVLWRKTRGVGLLAMHGKDGRKPLSIIASAYSAISAVEFCIF